MSNDFLQSSPSRHMIDPAIYNSFPDMQEDRNTSNSHTGNGNTSQHQQQPSAGPPSAQKNHNQLPSNLTGWTPLISKTIFNDQLISYNSTPSGKFFNGVLSGHVNNEIDYAQGLNLTPFLTHNLNIPNSNSHMNGISNITPFHDKTLHLTDFFMDSPIKQTPIKNIDTITPSKFKIGSERKYLKQSVFHDPKSASKRSITQIDTPPRQPHKVSILNKHEARYEKNNIIDDRVQSKDEDEENQGDEENEKKSGGISINKSKLYGQNLLTPSKTVLKDISNINKNQGKSTPMPKDSKKTKESFETPSKQIPDSSPSTVIMSSAVNSPPSKPLTTNDVDNGKNVTVKYSTTTQNLPPSPTPKKEIANNSDNVDVLKPTMGVFSEKKSKPLKTKPAVFKNLSSDSTGVTSSSMNTKTKSNSKTQMQAGMNKFQIVFTDVHTLMNKKNKSKKLNNAPPNPKLKRSQSANRSKDQSFHINDNTKPRSLTRSATAPVSNQQSYQTTHKTGSSHDHNVSMNTSSKEVSLISGNSNSMNTSNLNMSSTDHSSFELGGLSSTPNGKYFLDKMFDKPSPQSQQNLNANQYYSMHQHSLSNMPPPNPNTSRPPPTVAQNNLSHAQQQQQHPMMMMMMMMMSTPQHQNVVNYGSNVYNSNNEISPTSDNQFASNSNISSFSYQPYPKSGTPTHSMMGPMVANQKESSQYSQLIPVSTSDEDEDILLKREEEEDNV